MRALTLIRISCVFGMLACSTPKMIQNNRSPSSHNHIYSNQIQISAAVSAYDLISKLRPHWLSGRGSKSIRYGSTSFPVVYVGGQRYGDLDSLAAMATENISEIQFFNGGEAASRFGLDHPGGAILVTMK